MSTLRNPAHTVAYDPATDRIILTLRDGRAGQVVELDADATPALIDALMQARAAAKRARNPVPLPPPSVCPMAPVLQPERIPALASADRSPVRLNRPR